MSIWPGHLGDYLAEYIPFAEIQTASEVLPALAESATVDFSASVAGSEVLPALAESATINLVESAGLAASEVLPALAESVSLSIEALADDHPISIGAWRENRTLGTLQEGRHLGLWRESRAKLGTYQEGE